MIEKILKKSYELISGHDDLLYVTCELYTDYFFISILFRMFNLIHAL